MTHTVFTPRPTTEIVMRGLIPTRISLPAGIEARYNGGRYFVSFPKNTDALRVFRDLSGSDYSHEDGWSCRAHDVETVIETLEDMSDILNPDKTLFDADPAAASAAAAEDVYARRAARASAKAKIGWGNHIPRKLAIEAPAQAIEAEPLEEVDEIQMGL